MFFLYFKGFQYSFKFIIINYLFSIYYNNKPQQEMEFLKSISLGKPSDVIEGIPSCDWLRKNFYLDSSRVKFLGSGSFGKVYHMISKVDESHKAVKILILNDSNDFQKCLKEYDLQSKLCHPNIVKLFEKHSEKLNNCLYVVYLVYELARNSLKKEINNESKFEQVLFHHYSLQLVKALNYSHKSNIIHFDIKPDNILIFDDSLIKIADWGSAKIGLAKGTKTLKSESLFITKAFLSPELNVVIDQFDTFDLEKIKLNWEKNDIYSLGLTLLNSLGINAKGFRSFKLKNADLYK